MKYLILIFLFIPGFIFAKTEAVIDIDNLSISQIQENIEKGYLTYEQLVSIYLERIEEYNEQYNAVISINENALEEARALDKEFQESGMRSLMHGIPILVKDNIDVIGLPTTNGASGLLDAYPYEDADIIKNLRDSGAIFLGKTNMSEFAFYASYSYSSFGFVYNAYDTSYTAYGSSGGSAVSVGANLAVAAIGTDTNSSVRLPAAAANVVGLRPNQDSISGEGIIKYDADRDVAGPITKFVEDNLIMLEIMDNTEINYEITTEDLSGIKIGVFEDLIDESEYFIRDMMEVQISNLESLGAEIVYLDAIYLEYRFNGNSVCYDFNKHMLNTTSSIKTLYDLVDDGGYVNYIEMHIDNYCDYDYRLTSSYDNYLLYLEDNALYVSEYFFGKEIDALIYPTSHNEIITYKNTDMEYVDSYTSEIAPNTGFPSMSIPIGFYEGLSYGMEILTVNDEQLIFDIAYNLEKLNNFYELPLISPTLYEVSDIVKTLIVYYENYVYEDELYFEMNDFILNYNDISSKEEVALDLINKVDSRLDDLDDIGYTEFIDYSSVNMLIITSFLGFIVSSDFVIKFMRRYL